MNKRPVDRTKKSNIKCEHCKHWCEENADVVWYAKNCAITHQPKVYYNRCKNFEWKEAEE